MKEFIMKNIKVIIITILIIILSIIGITLAYTMDDIGIMIASGEYNVVYSGTATLPSANLTPIYDSELLNSENIDKVMKIEFTVKGAESNPTDIPIIYDVSLTNLDIPSELQSEYLKWRLYKNGTQLSEGNFSLDFDSQVNNRMVLTNIQQDLPSYISSVDSYVFYIWISEACVGDITTCTEEMDISELVNKTFSGEIRIELSTKGKKTLERITGEAGTTLGNLKPTIAISAETPDFDIIVPDVLTYKESEGDSGSSEIDQTTNTYYVTYADTYEFNEETGKYNLIEPSVAKYQDIYTDLVGKYIVSTTLSTSSSMASYTNLSKIYCVVSATYDDGVSLGVIEYNTSASQPDELDESDTGIFMAEDAQGISYYYRGNIQDNYVKFGKWNSDTPDVYFGYSKSTNTGYYVEYTSLEACKNASKYGCTFVSRKDKDMYWRIIRINGNGTIRMIYDGTEPHFNGETSDDRIIKSGGFGSGGENLNVGYMHGTSGAITYKDTHANLNNSGIKTYIDTWYKTNIVDTGYSSYVADAIYCNDRSLVSGTGIGDSDTIYGGYQRLKNDKEPTLKCDLAEYTNDKFTVSDELGNGALTYPVGLITADEVAMVKSGRYGSYLYMGNDYWTMTPVSGHYVFMIERETGILNTVFFTISAAGYRPVISLKADAIIGGTGTMIDPYVVE